LRDCELKRFILLLISIIGFISPALALDKEQHCLNINFDARAAYVRSKFQNTLPELQSIVKYNQVPRGLIVSIPTYKFFHQNSAVLTNEGIRLLDIIAEILNTFNNNCAIESHTDENIQGNSGYKEDWEISIHRANVLTEYLIKNGGISSERLYPIGYGELMPFYGNIAKEEFTNNRIDFVIFDYTARR